MIQMIEITFLEVWYYEVCLLKQIFRQIFYPFLPPESSSSMRIKEVSHIADLDLNHLAQPLGSKFNVF